MNCTTPKVPSNFSSMGRKSGMWNINSDSESSFRDLFIDNNIRIQEAMDIEKNQEIQPLQKLHRWNLSSG